MRLPSPPSARRAAPTWRLVLAAVVGLLVGLPGSAHAQEEPPAPPDAAQTPTRFAVQPSGPDGPGNRDWFSYTLAPGDSFGDLVAVSNLSERPIRFAIFATDATNVADVGGFAALKEDEVPVGVGTWITLGAERYTVEPGQRIDVPFRLTVPANAEPGDHAGAILAVDLDEGVGAAEDGVTFNVRHRLGARVYVRVSGPSEPALRIDQLTVERDGDTATISWDVRNTGNVRLDPTAKVRITGWFGRTVRTLPAQELPELLPGGNYVGAAAATGLPGLEPLTAHLVVEAEGVRTQRSHQFAGYPWLAIGLLLLLAALVGWWFTRRRRRRTSSTTPPARTTGRVATPV